MALHQLTDRAVKTAKPTDKERLIADGGGLFLRVLPTGFKSWLLVYSFDGKRSKLALGSATDVSLAVARDTAAQERARIAAGADPRVALMEREAEQAAQREALGVSLDVIDRCQNHVMPGSKIRRHYMHHDYADEKRDAWCKLGARIDAILAEA